MAEPEPPNVTPEQDASFGTRLKQLREVAGLTQEELASRAGLTAKAIGGALERGERRRPYPHTIRSLADALGLSEDERASLLAAVRKQGDAAPAAPATVVGSTLPTPTTQLLGRELNLEEIGGYIRRGVRLLTLTEPGGAGKTRLAIQAGRASLGAVLFPEGVAFVALAPLGNAALVLPTIGQSLNVREAENLTSYEALLEEIEAIAYPHASDPLLRRDQIDAAHRRLDKQTWELAWAEGRAMTTGQAIAEALGGRLGAPRGVKDA